MLGASLADLQSVTFDDLQVILCVEFDRRAPPADVAAFKQCLMNSSATFGSMEISGSFDFIVEIALADMAAYSEWLKSIGEPLSRLVRRYEENFVCKRFVRRESDEAAIWVPTETGMQRIDCSVINKITAEGDYVRIHCKGQSWLLHATMHALADQLVERGFVQIHRSTIVRCGFVERLVHKGRRWTARLENGAVEQIAKSHVAETIEAIRAHSSIVEPSPAMPAHTAELMTEVNEK